MNLGNIEVSHMTLEDIDDIMVVERLSFTIPWSRDAFIQEVTNNKFAIYISAKVDGLVVGYAGMWKVYDEGHITNVAVHPEYRRSGIGRHLVEKLISIAMQEKIERMTLEVRRSNIAAQGLYEKYGFKVEGCRKAYYSDNGEDAIIMWKEDV
ncbi:MAG: ribosomal protein S18-alanine N-acetyltransferase [Bacillota bacterium]